MSPDSKAPVALVTGSSHGIGLAIGSAFVEQGFRVVFNGRNQDALDRAMLDMPRDQIFAATGDVTKPEAARELVAKTLDTFGQLDVLVCNVGSGRSVPPGEETHEEWLRMLSVNLLSTTNMVECAREALSESKGSIVCVSSICGQEVVPGAPVTYGAAKAALNAYIRGISRPLGKLGVRINGVAPGNILFPGSVWERKLGDDSVAVRKMLQEQVALARLGQPDEVARLAIWLASPAAGFMTGSIVVVDGGQVRS